jgi:NADP-dependent 3-hydroxy acid dehydrogenase YdfG
MKVLRDRVAVVTGAASAIGLGIAGALTYEGAHLVLADIDSERLDMETERLRSSQVEAVVTLGCVPRRSCRIAKMWMLTDGESEGYRDT